MSSSSRFSIALLAACLPVLILVTTASAAAPATVTVRVEGLSATLLPTTQVTTTTAPVVRDGNAEHSCPGTSALGALQLATGGDWDGPWEPSFHEYTINSIEGESHAFFSGYFWDFWFNHAEAQKGACGEEEATEVLVFPCSEAAPSCPTPLGIEAPASADIGESVPVTVKRYSTVGVASTVEGASITGAAEAATTGPSGAATVHFTHTGEVTILANASESVRDEATICVHNGNDGTCGTTAPLATPAVSGAPAPVITPYTGPFALVSHVSGLIEGHHYSRGQAPRILSGQIVGHSPITSVGLELRREYRGRCYAFDGIRERFVRTRCGQGSPFVVSTGAAYSYLLPSTLPAGRYVLDVQATDEAGNHVSLARGTSRIVFYVR